MARKKRKLRKLVLIVLILAVWQFWYWKFAGHHLTFRPDNVRDNFWGVTFSTKYATQLGLDWKSVFTAMLDDLGVKHVRLPIYWDAIEHNPGSYDFSDYDWMVSEGEKRNVSFIAVIGRRLPRWPECHQPDWTKNIEEAEITMKHLEYSRRAIDHFSHSEAVVSWQLENEYFIPWFGICPESDIRILEEEIEYAKRKDTRHIVLTDSGELGFWGKAASKSDILGVTMYRVAWNKYFGYVRWPLPAWWYVFRGRLAGKQADNTIVAELQAEPWPADFEPIQNVPETELLRSFDLKQFETNVELARRTHFLQAYLWGVEWWYFMQQHGNAEFWNFARKVIQSSEYGQ